MSDDIAGSSPAPDASAAPSPAPATSAPATDASPTASAASGEPPKERWADILANARTKTRAEVEQEYRNRYSHYDEFERDPLRAVMGWLDQAREHSLYGPHIRQYFEQAYSSKQPQSVGEEPQPNVPIVDASGNVVDHTYSAKQLAKWHQWNEARLKHELDNRFGQLEHANATREEREQQFALQQQASSWASNTLSALREQPYFKDHEPAIRQALVDHPEWGDNVHAAYTHVLTTQILPTIGSATAAKTVESLTGKGAGTTVAPSGAPTGQFKPKGTGIAAMREALEYYDAHPEEAAAHAKR